MNAFSSMYHDQISSRLQLTRHHKGFSKGVSNAEALHHEQHSFVNKGEVSKICRCSVSCGVWLRCSFGTNRPNSLKGLTFIKHQQPCLLMPEGKYVLFKDARHIIHIRYFALQNEHKHYKRGLELIVIQMLAW